MSILKDQATDMFKNEWFLNWENDKQEHYAV